jgi:CBS domain-containing protein
MICPTCGCDNLPGSEQCRTCLHDLTHLDLPTAQDRVQRSLMEDTVAVLKPGPPVTLPPTASVGDAIRTMLRRDIGAVLVTDGGRVVGILSERDLLTRVAGLDNYAARPVCVIMTRDPETVRESDTLAFALYKMDSGSYRHLPVVRDGRAVGMISVRDMLRHITGLCRCP